jgi:uncharacterized protein
MDRMLEEATRVEVRPSGERGRGLYAAEQVRAGEVIRTINFVREVTAEHPLAAHERADHCARIDGRVYLVGEPDCFVNHACEPSAYKRFTEGGVLMVAMRDIEVGKEITYDYMMNSHGGDAWPCACGSARCRGSTAGSFFDLPPRVQARYRPYLAEWFVAAHSDRFPP